MSSHGAWPPLFDEAKCPDAIADKVDFDFIDDCLIEPAPPPIFDCPDITIPPSPPVPAACPVFEQGSVSSSGNVQLHFNITTETDNCPEAANTGVGRGQLNAVFTPDDCCNFIFDFDFDIEFDLNIVVPCPVIAGSATAETNRDSSGSVNAPCGGDADVDVALSVTRINVGGPSCEDACQYLFDFIFDFTIPQPVIPCPTLLGSATATAGFGAEDNQNCGQPPEVEVSLTVTNERVGSDSCNPSCLTFFDFDFEFTIPPPVPVAPMFDGTATATATFTSDGDCGGQPSVSVSLTVETIDISTLPGGGGGGGEGENDPCNPELLVNFDFDFDFTIPPPVPILPIIMGEASATVNSAGEHNCSGDPQVNVRLNISQTDPGNSCNPSAEYLFDFEFDFQIPGTPPVCPEVDGSANATTNGGEGGERPCGGEPSVFVELMVENTNDISGCEASCMPFFNFDFEFTLPDPQIPCPTITATAAGTVTAEAASCDEYGNLIGGGEPGVFIDVAVTPEVGEDPCNPECAYHFDFEFDFTLPGYYEADSCPDIDGSARATVTVTDDCDEPEVDVTLTVTKTEDTEDECNQHCDYLFDFEFDFCLPPGGGGHCCGCFAASAYVDTVTTLDCGEMATADVRLVSYWDSIGSYCSYDFHFDFGIPEGCEGPSGPEGPPGPPGPPGSDGDKYAIVPLLLDLPSGAPPSEHVGLVCVEMPEVRFEDVLVISLDKSGQGRAPIDPIFLSVCEPGSIKVISLAPSVPLAVGAQVDGDSVVLRADREPVGHAYVNVKISGIRRGRGGIRFPRFSDREYHKNRNFWEGWNKN